MLPMVPFTSLRLSPLTLPVYLLRISALIRRIIARRLSEGSAPVIASIRSPHLHRHRLIGGGAASEIVTPTVGRRVDAADRRRARSCETSEAGPSIVWIT